MGKPGTILLRLCMVCTMMLLHNIETTSSAPTPDPSLTTFPHNPNQRNISTIIEHSSDSELYVVLIEIMKKLNIFPSNSACIQLQKISTDVITRNKTTNSQTVGVYLYFHRRDNSSLKHSGNCSSVPVVVNVDGLSWMKDGVLLEDSKMVTATPGSTPMNHSAVGVLVGAHSNAVQDTKQTDDTSGISRTQLVVISTCSAIIGTFFIVAGILRIRYYYKRYQEEQNLAQRPTFRSCSIALRNPTASTEHISRDSMLSKSSSYQSNCTHNKSSNHSQNGIFTRDQSGNNSPKVSADKMPLLIVTSASDPASPESSTSQQSFQYIDDEPTKKKDCPYTVDQEDLETEPLLTKEIGERDTTPSTIGEDQPLLILDSNMDDPPDVGNSDIGFNPGQANIGTNDTNDENLIERNCVEVSMLPDINPRLESSQQCGNDSREAAKDKNPVAESLVVIDDDDDSSIPSTGFGLTQSDSSLCAADPYQHSCQLEYSPPPAEPPSLIPRSITHTSSPKPLLRSASLPARSAVDSYGYTRFNNSSLGVTGPSQSLVAYQNPLLKEDSVAMVSESSFEDSFDDGRNSVDKKRPVLQESKAVSQSSMDSSCFDDRNRVGESGHPLLGDGSASVSQTSFDSHSGEKVNDSGKQNGSVSLERKSVNNNALQDEKGVDNSEQMFDKCDKEKVMLGQKLSDNQKGGNLEQIQCDKKGDKSGDQKGGNLEQIQCDKKVDKSGDQKGGNSSGEERDNMDGINKQNDGLNKESLETLLSSKKTTLL